MKLPGHGVGCADTGALIEPYKSPAVTYNNN